MKRLLKSAIALSLLLGAGACQPTMGELSDADLTAIKATTERWVVAARVNDWDLAAKELASDIVFQPSGSPAIVGHAAVVAYAKTYPTITKFTYTIDDVKGRGDLAYSRGTYSIDMTLPDSMKVSEQGNFVEIHRKQADGTWPYTVLMWHSSAPPPAPPPPAKK